jgi:hypothetical protein
MSVAFSVYPVWRGHSCPRRTWAGKVGGQECPPCTMAMGDRHSCPRRAWAWGKVWRTRMSALHDGDGGSAFLPAKSVGLGESLADKNVRPTRWRWGIGVPAREGRGPGGKLADRNVRPARWRWGIGIPAGEKLGPGGKFGGQECPRYTMAMGDRHFCPRKVFREKAGGQECPPHTMFCPHGIRPTPARPTATGILPELSLGLF